MVRSVRSTSFVLALALACAACFFAVPASAAKTPPPCTAKTAKAGEWQSYGHDWSNSRTQNVPQGIGPDKVGSLKVAWTFLTQSGGDGSGFSSTPVVDGGCVFAGSFNGYTYALDVKDGHVVWQHKVDIPHIAFGGGIVSSPALYGTNLIYIIDEEGGPYAIALDRSTGAEVWRSKPWVTATPNQFKDNYFSHANPLLVGNLFVAGYSAPEGDRTGQGGFVILDANNGNLLKLTQTIPPADQAKGFAGGGLWSTPAYDPSTKYAYWGAGNPFNKTEEHPYTNSILKVDLDPSRATFGTIVGYYKGNVDQYDETLQKLSQNPACGASDNENIPDPTDDPVCGQLDLDFGASANLFTLNDGTKVVGDLQKSGVYHVARTDNMKPVWQTQVGVTCYLCNADSTAFDGNSIIGVAGPHTAQFALGRNDGSISWLGPVGDVIHYEATSVADGVAWTQGSDGFLDAFDAKTGAPLAHRPMAADAQFPISNEGNAAGVAIAEGTVVTNGGAAYGTSFPGYVVAYRP